MKTNLSLILLSIFPFKLTAAKQAPAIIEPLSAGSMLQVFTGLILVLLLFGGLVFVLKRVGGFRSTQSEKMNVVDAVSVGTRERVLLLQVGEKQVLIGVSASGISPISVFDEAVISPSEASEKGFSGHLQDQLTKHIKKTTTNKDVS